MITRENFEVPNVIVPLADDRSNIGDFFCADTIGGKSFVLNDAGYPLNDIDLIVRQQDLVVAESLLSQLNEIPTTGYPVDTPNEKVLLGLRSRYCTTPAEMVRYYERQLELRELENVPNETPETIKFDNPDSVDNV